MSIASLASMKASRERALVRSRTPGVELVAADDAASKKTISDALTAVAAYIPTEIIAVYTLVIAMTVSDATLGPDGQVVQATLPLWAFVAFLVTIPLFVWLIYAVDKVEDKQPIPWSPKQWPYWEAASALIAFTVWQAALPKSAFLRWSWYSVPVASIALVVVSLLLPLVGILVTKKVPAA